MEIILKKEDFLNAVKVVEKTTAQKPIQPALSNILIETISSDRVLFAATDLVQSVSLKSNAEVLEQGKTTVNAKKINDIVLKLEDKPVKISAPEDDNKITITCGKSKFVLNTINSSEFPQIFNVQEEENLKSFEINKETFNKSVKQTVYCCAQTETTGILGGVCVNIEENTIEFAATDGNRLTAIKRAINSKNESENFIIPCKTLNELTRIFGIIEDENVKIQVNKSKISFVFKDVIFTSKTIDGIYPKYKQLIPTNNEKIIEFNKDEIINAIERVAVMVNERTNIIKLIFEENKLTLKADTSETGVASEELDIDYKYEDLIIAFNYKYLLDCFKNIEGNKIRAEMSTSLSATIFKPVDDNNESVCLIMPVQVK